MLDTDHGEEMKDLEYYEGLPYYAVWEHVATADGDWYWQVHLQEIPAVAGVGASEHEALDELRDRFEEYVLFSLEEGLDIPEPHAHVSWGPSGNGKAGATGDGGDGRPAGPL
jgi:predicted RNase H-like HicB family nuclease